MEAGKRRLAGDTARSATTGEVQDLRREACALKECVADLTLENRLLKKHDRRWGRRRMRYSASEKLEIIRIVEHPHLPTKRTLDQLGIPADVLSLVRRYLEGAARSTIGDEPVWNSVSDDIQDQIVEMAWIIASYHHVNWPCGSPTRSATVR